MPVASVLVLAALAAVALLCAATAPSAAEQTLPADILEVDLSLPAEQRWAKAIAHYGGPKAGVAIKGYFLGLAKVVPKEVLELLEVVAGDLDKYGGMIPADLRVEMKALADGLGLDVGLVLALNYVYALRNLAGAANTTGPLPPRLASMVGKPSPYHHAIGGGACTSVVATDAKDGLPVHVRNMDWNLPTPVRKLTFQCNFVNGKTPVFQGACFLGFVGISSGVRFDGNNPGFGITINERGDGGELLIDVLTGVLEGAWDPTHALREVLSTSTTYENALSALRDIKLASPVYYILSGTKRDEGHVITRNRLSVHSDRVLGQTGPSGGDAPYYVFQTNYDHDKPAPSYDDRRKYAREFLNGLGASGVSATSVFKDVISRWPVLNQHTSYTTVMEPSKGYLKLYIRLNTTAEADF